MLLESNEYDILVFTESWLKCTTPNSFLCSGLGYNVYRCDRSDGFGGVVTFVRHELNVVEVQNRSVANSDFICMYIFHNKGDRLRHFAVYNPPRSKAE